MTVTDWRTHDTPEFQAAFGDAQARLDFGEYPPGEAGAVLRQCDEALTDRYDRLVLQPAQDEFDRQCAQAEFELGWPEPADGARIEWEFDDKVWGAYRQDDTDKAATGTWYLYGEDKPYTWPRLVAEFHFYAGLSNVTILVEAVSCGE